MVAPAGEHGQGEDGGHGPRQRQKPLGPAAGPQTQHQKEEVCGLDARRGIPPGLAAAPGRRPSTGEVGAVSSRKRAPSSPANCA